PPTGVMITCRTTGIAPCVARGESRPAPAGRGLPGCRELSNTTSHRQTVRTIRTSGPRCGTTRGGMPSPIRRMNPVSYQIQGHPPITGDGAHPVLQTGQSVWQTVLLPGYPGVVATCAAGRRGSGPVRSARGPPRPRAGQGLRSSTLFAGVGVGIEVRHDGRLYLYARVQVRGR